MRYPPDTDYDTLNSPDNSAVIQPDSFQCWFSSVQFSSIMNFAKITLIQQTKVTLFSSVP